jgi:DNA-binding response OmpR family regulator
MTHILVVEDESNLVDLLRGYLEQEGYQVSQASDGPEGVRQAHETHPDLIILDVMLPGFDGVEVCRQIRRFSDAYVLMLTARAEELDKIVGLSVGADDYVAKPFSPREVVARVKALLRRPRGQPGTSLSADMREPAVLRCGDLTIDEGQHMVRRGTEEIPLTAREFSLLLTLARHPGRVFTRPQLLEQVWGDEYYDDHVVDVHVGNLRKKLLDESAEPRYVQTVRGVGYRLAAQASRTP